MGRGVHPVSEIRGICLWLAILFTESQLSNQININVTTVEPVLSGHFVYKMLYNSGRNRKVKVEIVTVTCEQSVRLFLFYFQKLSIQATKDLIGTVLDEEVCTAFTPFGFCFLCIVIVTVV